MFNTRVDTFDAARFRDIFSLYADGGHTLQEIGTRYGISKQRVHAIIKKYASKEEHAYLAHKRKVHDAARQRAIEIATDLLKVKVSQRMVSLTTGLSFKQVQSIAKKLKEEQAS